MRSDSVWWYVFVLAFVATALVETFLPFRSLASSTARRWISNSILLAVSSAAVLCAYQLSGVALAFTIRAASYGALNRVPIRYGVQFAVGFVALDLTAYVSHRLFHAVTPMWRVHQVHHSETDLDLTTGLRFHPIEALFTQGLLLTTIALLGPPPGAVAFSALAVIVQDFFTHANLRISEITDRALRLLIVTPAMHRVHHSEAIPEQNANFGTVFSIWDRLFRTYLAGHASEQTRCGLVELARGSELNATRLLFLPFRRSSKQTS
jgi:sterol desaturase/sphingolipid hydroxylase (fatty acid hydroxylase superfamily)